MKQIKKQVKKQVKKIKQKISRKKLLWIIVPSAVIFLIACILLGLYFYFCYYLKPNFAEEQFQNMVSSKPGNVKPEDRITYTINFKNTGNTAVEDVVISTAIPANTELLTSEPEAGPVGETGSIIFNVGSIPKNTEGKVSFTVQVDSPLDNGTIIKAGSAKFSYLLRDESLSFNIPGNLENIVVSSPVFSGFELDYEDLNKGDINIGDDIEFTIRIKNTGDMDAKNVQIVNNCHEKFEIHKGSVKAPGFMDNEENTITYDIKKLEAGQSRSFKFEAKVGQSFEHKEAFKNIARVIYGDEIIKEVTVEGEVKGYPDFSESAYSIKDVNGGSVWAGDTLKYTVVVKNTGIRPGKDFKLVCPVPASTSYLSGSAGPGEGLKYTGSESALTWEIDNLDVGQEKIFEFSVHISDSLTGGGAIKSAFYIEGDEQYVELEPKTVGVRKFIFHTVVCMGDSLLAYTNWAAGLDNMLESTYPRAEYNTVAVAVPGQASFQALSKFDSTVAPHGPQIVILGFGSNDVGAGMNSYRYAMTQLINKAKGIGATVIVHSIGYINTNIWTAKTDYKAYNDVLREVCASTGVPYVDVYTPLAANPGKYISDGLHWTSEGANLVANLVYNTLVNYLDGDGERK